jgi:hypothetical protein
MALAPKYSADQDRGCPEGVNRPALSIAPDSADLDPWSKAWKPVDTSTVRMKNGEFDLQMRVPPHTAVHIDQVADEWACVDVLEIESGSRTNLFVGRDIVNAFKKRSRSLWVYEIRT